MMEEKKKKSQRRAFSVRYGCLEKAAQGNAVVNLYTFIRIMYAYIYCRRF